VTARAEEDRSRARRVVRKAAAMTARRGRERE
jgi:hypothetical protein